jgi:hypothetical protein
VSASTQHNVIIYYKNKNVEVILCKEWDNISKMEMIAQFNPLAPEFSFKF